MATEKKLFTLLDLCVSSLRITTNIDNITAARAVDRELIYIELGDLFPHTPTRTATTTATATTTNQTKSQQQEQEQQPSVLERKREKEHCKN